MLRMGADYRIGLGNDVRRCAYRVPSLSMRVWFGRLVPLAVKLPLATLKLDD
jgi:hypothetical protein